MCGVWQTLIEPHIWGMGGDLSLFFFIKICQNHTHTPEKNSNILLHIPLFITKIVSFCQIIFFGEGVITFLSTSYFFNDPFTNMSPIKAKSVLGCSSLWLHHKIEREDRWRCSNFHLRWCNSKIDKVESKNWLIILKELEK